MQMAAAALGADAVIVRGEDTQAQRDYWQYPKNQRNRDQVYRLNTAAGNVYGRQLRNDLGCVSISVERIGTSS
jgi:hypothetical protein